MALQDLFRRRASRAASQSQRVIGQALQLRTLSQVRAVLSRHRRDLDEAYRTPSFEPHPIHPYQPPDPQAYRRTWESARADVAQLMEGAKNAAEALRRLFVQRNDTAASLAGTLQKLAREVEAAELLSEGAAQRLEMLRIDFTDPSIADPSLITGTPALQDVKRGVLMQGVLRQENRTSGAMIQPVVGDTARFPWGHGLIGELSNGLPGNTHEVRPSNDPSSGYAYEFVGADDAHVNYVDVLDRALDTWFEYEAVNVAPEVIEETKGYGWSWQLENGKKIPWVFEPDGGVLRLTLRLRFNEPVETNEIIIHPFTPPQEGARPPVLTGVRAVAGEDGEAYDLAAEITQGPQGDWRISFPAQTVQVLDFTFEQPHAYSTLIGHWAYWRRTTVERTTTRFFGLSRSSKRETNVQRVDGPELPISALGVVNVTPEGLASFGTGIAAAGTVAYAIGAAASAASAWGVAGAAGVAALGPIGLAAVAVGVILVGLFGSTQERVVEDRVEIDLEAFPGERWCIGIREIEVLSRVYAPRSVWVSKPIRASKPIRSIRLDAVERVPRGYTHGAVKYEVSFDDGKTWHAIRPTSTWQGEAPMILYLGGRDAIEDDPARARQIDAVSNTVRLRITLTGDASRPYETAQVDQVTLWVTTEDDEV